MSIESLINQFGITLYIREPSYTVESDGSVNRAYARVTNQVGFIQPSGQSEPVAQGRLEGRTSCTIYFLGSLNISIDAEIHDSEGLTARQWRVTGVTNPGDVGVSGARPYLNMTVCEAVQIEPDFVSLSP